MITARKQRPNTERIDKQIERTKSGTRREPRRREDIEREKRAKSENIPKKEQRERTEK